MPRALYRVHQFIQALAAQPLTPRERERVASILPASQQVLFGRMSASDQRHSLQVMQTVTAQGESDADLLAAALLHDLGKSFYPLRLWERPAVVLIRHLRPLAADRWGRQTEGEPLGWRRPFVIYEQHAVWGARMAEAAGCSPRTVWLIRWHHASSDGRNAGLQSTAPPESPALQARERPASELLRVLQRADSIN